mgnify:FL=1
MLLPENFTFTQQNLQDFSDCPYRFFLKHIQQLEWPAVESEPVIAQEALIDLGTRFHMLCQQYLSGIPSELLSESITQPDLIIWWSNFLTLDLINQPAQRKVEKLISIPFAGFRLAAKIDLLIRLPDGQVKLYDWKTSQHQPKRLTILSRMQSKVYPLVAVESLLPKVKPSAIEMIYWYPAFPETPIKTPYSETRYTEEYGDLEEMIKNIASLTEAGFQKTDKEKTCNFCRYRSLCNRGVVAGMITEIQELPKGEDPFELDFDSI